VRFKDIIRRVTGISTPFFGISWNPEKTETDVARQVITYLEDRRVLYEPSEMEVPWQCVESILQIRQFLTPIIGNLPEKTELSQSLRAMRAACRKFLDRTGAKGGDIVQYGARTNHWASWEFNGAVGELRGVFGIHIAKIAVAYGIDVEKELASIIPEEDID
jgi:hypothetical protein